ncbi:MAG: alpha/beta fold hydrolase [Gemmatimonadetes bacterium]|nr:alpha/beta fold hydrolase [Gemmatimonadota bacterium]NIO33121.1 alpha/beta fold hydrolase [Gemmatimonadota bacterium]
MDRDAEAGRRIRLRIGVLRAGSSDPLADPVFIFNGGPGGAATELAAFVAEDLSVVRDRRHIVMVDRRGSGESNGLDCPEVTGGNDLQRYFTERGPEAAAQCRAILEERADLRLYTTPIAMDDIDEVRAAMGYDRVNLWGGSYGSREALVYSRRHPGRVRSVTIWAVIPPHRNSLTGAGRHAQQAMDRLLADCAADDACRFAYPDLRHEFEEVLRRLDEAPARFVNSDSRLGDPDTITVTRDQIGATLRFMLVSQGGASQIPAFVQAAYRGDFGPLGERALLQRRLGPTAFSRGLFLSVICAEEVVRLPKEELSEIFAGTFWGESWVRGIVDDCAGWPIGELPPGHFEPVAGTTPVLIQHGWLDPITPPAWAYELTRHLPNARVMVIREGHHNIGYEECGRRLVAEFIDNLDPASLDLSCTAEMKRPPFLVPRR